MKQSFRRVLLAASVLLCSLLAEPAVAESAYAVVDALRMPAWLERQGKRQPLVPGQVLRNRDRVTTGAEARVVIRLAEGSVVKLGENARLELNALGRRERGVLTAALSVSQGALRFTSDVYPAKAAARAVNFRVAGVTAGLRGGDLWLSAEAKREVLCLLDGRVTVVPAGSEARELNEPLSAYIVSEAETPVAMSRVSAADAALWSMQTEMQEGSGYVMRGGAWKVELATLASQSEALALYDQARAAGYAVSIKPRAVDGAYRYALRATQLPSRDEAEALAARLARDLQLDAPLVARF